MRRVVPPSCVTPLLIAVLAAAGCRDRGAQSAPPKPEAARTAESASDAGPRPIAIARGSGRPLVLVFTRDHCLPCELMAPWVQELARRHAGRVDFLTVNLDREENRELQGFFRVSGVPLQVFIDGRGREVDRHSGLATLEELGALLARRGFTPAADTDPLSAPPAGSP